MRVPGVSFSPKRMCNQSATATGLEQWRYVPTSKCQSVNKVFHYLGANGSVFTCRMLYPAHRKVERVCGQVMSHRTELSLT